MPKAFMAFTAYEVHAKEPRGVFVGMVADPCKGIVDNQGKDSY